MICNIYGSEQKRLTFRNRNYGKIIMGTCNKHVITNCNKHIIPYVNVKLPNYVCTCGTAQLQGKTNMSSTHMMLTSFLRVSRECFGYLQV